MKELEMIKAFAKLEGIEWRLEKNGGLVGLSQLLRFTKGEQKSCMWTNYNPLTDFTLTFKAMVKYKVQKITEVYNGVEFNTFHIGGESRVSVSDDKLIPKAIIQCILKSEGGCVMKEIKEDKLEEAKLLLEAVLVHFEPHVASQLKLLAEIEDFIDK